MPRKEVEITIDGAFLKEPVTMPFEDCLSYLEQLHVEHVENASANKPVPQSVISIAGKRRFQHIATEVLWNKEPALLHMLVDVSTAHELHLQKTINRC